MATTAWAVDACEIGWSIQEPALQAMSGGVAGCYDGKVFIGGCGAGVFYQKVQIYDIALDTWSEGAAYDNDDSSDDDDDDDDSCCG